MEDRLLKAQQALTKHGIDTRIVATAAEAKQLVLDEVEPGQKVGVGGSAHGGFSGCGAGTGSQRLPNILALARPDPGRGQGAEAGPTHSRCFFGQFQRSHRKTVAWSISMVPATGWRLWYMARIK